MKTFSISGQNYRLPSKPTAFQFGLYVHLIDWKRQHLTTESGTDRGYVYDAILPPPMKAANQPVYRPILERFERHCREQKVQIHRFMGHMASSQAACANLFLPMLERPRQAAAVLRSVRPDLVEIATEHLDDGWRLEFWDKGLDHLGDHQGPTGTDVDIAIAYRDAAGVLCLWLIEHKLGEAEFTNCGGARSKGRTGAHRCEPAAAVFENPELCYYQSSCGFNYWRLTHTMPGLLDDDALRSGHRCAFRGGANQLWRNLLMARALELAPSDQVPFQRVTFSVVHHPENPNLRSTLSRFRSLLGPSARFDVFTSDQLVGASAGSSDPFVASWRAWYQDLYRLTDADRAAAHAYRHGKIVGT